MANKCIVVISKMVDATVKEYQPDVDFKMFKSIDGLTEYLQHNPIRADLLFFTPDVVSSAATSFSYLKEVLTDNVYISVDRVIYICEEDAKELVALRYLIDEFELDTWDVIKGNVNRGFVQEVINGTYREDAYKTKRKAVIRRPRADYVREKLKNMDSLAEDYTDDENDLTDIPDVEIPDAPIDVKPLNLQKVYITGLKSKERTAFSVLTAQYLSRSDKVILLESDPDYHLVTEFVTKAKIPCSVITITDIFENLGQALSNIRNAENNLVVIECIDRIPFDYRYLSNLLYYNLKDDFSYIINEVEIEELPYNVPVTVVIPSTVTDLLATGERIDKSLVPYCRFVGVDLKDLPETHISSGLAMSKILNDILTETNILCPVVTVSSLRLGDVAYDLGGIFGRSVLL